MSTYGSIQFYSSLLVATEICVGFPALERTLNSVAESANVHFLLDPFCPTSWPPPALDKFITTHWCIIAILMGLRSNGEWCFFQYYTTSSRVPFGTLCTTQSQWLSMQGKPKSIRLPTAQRSSIHLLHYQNSHHNDFYFRFIVMQIFCILYVKKSSRLDCDIS